MLRTALVRKPLLQERPCEHFDIGRAHICRLPTAKCGRDMDSLHVLAVLAVGLARTAQLEPIAQRVDDLIDGRHVSAGQRPRRGLLGLLQLAERALGLGTGESLASPGLADRPDLAVQQSPVERAPATVVGVPLLIQMPCTGVPLGAHISGSCSISSIHPSTAERR
jgi:hypothetical protein